MNNKLLNYLCAIFLSPLCLRFHFLIFPPPPLPLLVPLLLLLLIHKYYERIAILIFPDGFAVQTVLSADAQVATERHRHNIPVSAPAIYRGALQLQFILQLFHTYFYFCLIKFINIVRSSLMW